MDAATPADHAEHYRCMAEATRELARTAADESTRSSYLGFAARWIELAERVDAAGREDRE